jgi:hypothetical protein
VCSLGWRVLGSPVAVCHLSVMQRKVEKSRSRSCWKKQLETADFHREINMVEAVLAYIDGTPPMCLHYQWCLGSCRSRMPCAHRDRPEAPQGA